MSEPSPPAATRPHPVRHILLLAGAMVAMATALALVVGVGTILHAQLGKRARHERRLIHQPAKNFSEPLPAEAK